MLRAARFEAKLGFDLDPDTAAPIGPLAPLLAAVPPARLFDETLKLFLTGHGARSYEVLKRRGLLRELLPSVAAYFDAHPGSLVEGLLVRGLENTDARVAADKSVTPTLLFALLLYGPIAARIEALPPERWHEMSAIAEACEQAARGLLPRVALPKRFSLGVRDMFMMQPRLESPRGRRALRLIEQPRFRAGFDLLALRAEMGLASREIADWWAHVQAATGEERERLAEALDARPAPQGGPGARAGAAGGGGGRRRRRGRRGRRGAPPAG
jgi:poly(A) polymerase